MDRPGVPGIGMFLTAATAHLPPSDHVRLLSGEARLGLASWRYARGSARR